MRDVVADLLARSHRLGADRRNTNYAGGNASAKGTETDPSTGETVELLWVKGSGGDLGTLTEEGLAVLRLDRLRALQAVYQGAPCEDEMVPLFDYCLHGRGGAAPSIDTAMHGLVDAAHVDHLHPDSGIAIATAADGEHLTKHIYGDRVVWVPWRRPGFQLGVDIAAVHSTHPQAIGVVLGGHGITAWGSTSDEAEANSLWIIETARAYIEARGDSQPFGPAVDDRRPLPPAERRAKAAALTPFLRSVASRDQRVVGHFTDTTEVLEFLASAKLFALAELGTSCPDHFLRTKVKPLVLDLPSEAPIDECVERIGELHEQYRKAYRAYYERHATADSPPIRGADPAIVLVPGVGMFSYGRDKQTARVAGEFYVNAINVMRGAEAISAYTPIPESEKFRIEYWSLEQAKLQRLPRPSRHAGRIALVTGAAGGIGRAIASRLAAQGACVVMADLEPAHPAGAAEEIGDGDVAIGVAVDVTDAESVHAAVEAALLAFGGIDLVVNNAGVSVSASLLETTEADWDRQHDVMAKGSFLVARRRGKGDDRPGHGRRHRVRRVEERCVRWSEQRGLRCRQGRPGPPGSPSRRRARRARHSRQRREPGRGRAGSGIFAGGWGAQRAAVYGVAEEDLGSFYAERTLLKREVLPEHVAAVVAALTSDEFSHTTGLLVPVDAGVAAAFLR